jgi:cytochrome P450
MAMEHATIASAGIDLSDPDLHAHGDPHEVWRQLRARGPVHWNEEPNGPGFWAVVRYAEAVQVYRDTDAFSSARGIVLRADRRAPDPGGGRMLALTDPPRHGKVRALVNRAFTPRTVARLEHTIRAVADSLVATALEQRRCEFVDGIAARLPVALTCDLMGVPSADWERMVELTQRAFGSDDPAFQTGSSSRLSAGRAHSEIMLFYGGLIAERRREPRDDLVSALANGRVDGEPLTTKEILLHCDNLLVAGLETVRHAIVGGLLALIERPERWRALASDRRLLDTGADEILRWTSPAVHVLRTASHDVQLGGQQVRAGDAVTIWNPSANRDEAVFAEPDRFDLARRPNRHLALGIGEHYCLGASLARLELRAVFGALLRSVRRVELAGPVLRLRSNLIAGYRSLPVELWPR